jgi:predicted ATPase
MWHFRRPIARNQPKTQGLLREKSITGSKLDLCTFSEPNHPEKPRNLGKLDFMDTPDLAKAFKNSGRDAWKAWKTRHSAPTKKCTSRAKDCGRWIRWRSASDSRTPRRNGVEVMSTTAQGNGRSSSDPRGPFIRRVKVRNYKSLEKCDVQLGRLTILVGRNGSGKSNFLDALRFVVDALRTSLDQAIKSRGGIDEVRRRSTGHPRNFGLELDMDLGNGPRADYGFEVAARSNGGFTVKRERLQIKNGAGRAIASYDLKDGKRVSATSSARNGKPLPGLNDEPIMPPASPDRLYLVNAAGLPEFRDVYDALLTMGFYNLNPESMKALQSPDAGEILHRDGGNIASVIGRIGVDQPKNKDRIKGFLATIVPGVTDVNRVSLGPKETLQFRQKVSKSATHWKFYGTSMSDGTLRALGALVAVAQLAEMSIPVRLVGIEEPETALHPAASGALMDALREASVHTQILVTTHSPDLLDRLESDNDIDRLLVCRSRDGDTEIGPIDPASSEAIKDHLYSAGELLRMDQLEPDPADRQRQKQMTMFETAMVQEGAASGSHRSLKVTEKSSVSASCWSEFG